MVFVELPRVRCGSSLLNIGSDHLAGDDHYNAGINGPNVCSGILIGKEGNPSNHDTIIGHYELLGKCGVFPAVNRATARVVWITNSCDLTV